MLYELFGPFICIKEYFLLYLIPLITEGLFQLFASALSMHICWKVAPKNPNIHFSFQNVILLLLFLLN